MKAIFLAAGMGNRFGKSNLPKPLLKVGGKTIIEHSLDSVIKEGGVEDIAIVTGHLGEKIKKTLGPKYLGVPLTYIENTQYQTTDSMHSLYLARNFCDRDVIILESDLVYDSGLSKIITESPYPNALVVSNLTNSGDEVLVSSVNGNSIRDIGKNIKRENIVGEFIGISRLSKPFLDKLFPFFEKYYIGKKVYCENVFYESVKQTKEFLKLIHVPNLIWTEIDTKSDLKKARKIFNKLSKK